MTIARPALRLVLALSLALAAVTSTQAGPPVDTTWTGAIDSFWSTAGNWSAGVPSVNHAILDDSGANRTIVLPGAATASQLITTGSGYGLTSGTLTLSDQLYIVGSNASLTLSGGARVTAPNSSVGLGAGDSGNSLSVGSTLAVAGTLNVGYEASNNSLQITNGGAVTAGGVWVGGQSTASGNSVTVNGGGLLTSTSSIVVGYGGSGNTFSTTTFGTVSARETYVGYDASAGGNTVSLLNASTWTNAGRLTVGLSGTGNSFQATGATVSVTGTANDVIIGHDVGANGNSMSINGGSFSSQAAFVVGRSGTGNTFSATNGAAITSNNVRIGLNAGSTGNSAVVSGSLSSWTVNGKLRVGSDGAGNSLDVLNGAQMTVASDIFVGGTGTGSNVSDNSINILNGATLAILSGTADLVIGYGSGTNNTVTVADGGTLALSSVKMGPGGKLAIGMGGAAGTVSPAAVIDAPFGGGRLEFNHNESDYQFANPIKGSVSVVQAGPGRTVINGTANTYTGKTTVSSGTLALAGATNPIASSGTIAVAAGSVLHVGGVTGFELAAGQTLEGVGTVRGNIQTGTGSILAPGLGGIGTLTFDSDVAILGMLKLDVSGTSADRLSVAGGTLTLGPASVLDFTVGAPLADQPFFLAAYDKLEGTFGSITNLPTGYTVNYDYLGTSQVALVPVPEPASLALLAAGCVAAVMIRRRSR